MSFIAQQTDNFVKWDYIMGNYYKGMSIAVNRYYYLWDLNTHSPLKISLKDPENDHWTKWCAFPSLLFEVGSFNNSGLTAAIDVHRSILPNEIIIESDYPTYEENYHAIRIVGQLIEKKGFKPSYYYSGNKSIHIHCLFNWDCLKDLDILTQDQLRTNFRGSKLRFKRKFIRWLRGKMISCWDTNIRKFDKDLINGTHLIRCELSRNKKGYKTFLGNTYKDVSSIPYICNEENRIYPKLGKLVLSSPNNIQGLIEEFIDDVKIYGQKGDETKNNKSLGDYFGENKPAGLRECVKLILSDDFKKVGDGTKRGLFILLNELRDVFGDIQARVIVKDWNEKMGFPLKDSEIEYRLKMKIYSLSCDYIHSFLKELGLNPSGKCKRKVYK